MAGNSRLYIKLLRQFAERQALAGQELAAALGAGDRTTAERIAHTVNGVASNLGFSALQSSADALETAIRAQSESDAQVEQMIEGLSLAVRAIRQSLGGGLVAAPAVLTGDSAQRAVELARLLEANDGAAPDYMEQHAASLRGALGKDSFEQLESDVNNFDFEAARQTLERALATQDTLFREGTP
ncbi:Hpt domain protein [compost metagenome]